MGSHIEIDEGAKAQLTAILQAGARLYMHFTEEVLAIGGPTAEPTVRRHLREYGSWRGREMRQAHNALGGSIDMETLMRRWDSASTYVVSDEMESSGSYAPSDVQHDVHYCPASLAWKEAGFHRWGHVYCDEVHQSIAGSYHPDGIVVIPTNLMKGDSHCSFRWVLPGGVEAFEAGEPTELGKRLARMYPGTDTDPAEGLRSALQRTSRLVAGRFLTYARSMETGEMPAGVLDRAIEVWASQRGELLAEQLRAAGTPLTPAALIEHLDVAPLRIWDMDIEQCDDEGFAASVQDTPFDELFRDEQAGQCAASFWLVSLPAIVSGFAPDWECRVTLQPGETPRLERVEITRVN